MRLLLALLCGLGLHLATDVRHTSSRRRRPTCARCGLWLVAVVCLLAASSPLAAQPRPTSPDLVLTEQVTQVATVYTISGGGRALVVLAVLPGGWGRLAIQATDHVRLFDLPPEATMQMLARMRYAAGQGRPPAPAPRRLLTA